jgi:hypothetical protein
LSQRTLLPCLDNSAEKSSSPPLFLFLWVYSSSHGTAEVNDNRYQLRSSAPAAFENSTVMEIPTQARTEHTREVATFTPPVTGANGFSHRKHTSQDLGVHVKTSIQECNASKAQQSISTIGKPSRGSSNASSHPREGISIQATTAKVYAIPPNFANNASTFFWFFPVLTV